MNKIFIIGNLVRDPELRTTPNGVAVCTFTVAVNRRQTAEAGKPDADFFRVTAWRALGENCNRYLSKGKKVGITGTLTLQAYTGNDGQQRQSLEVQADEVEFLSPRNELSDANESQFIKVDNEELPF